MSDGQYARVVRELTGGDAENDAASYRRIIELQRQTIASLRAALVDAKACTAAQELALRELRALIPRLQALVRRHYPELVTSILEPKGD
jgi:hypothetical protein